MTHRYLRAEPPDSMPFTSKGRTDINKDGRKGRRPRPRDRNGDAVRPGDHGQARAQRLRGEFATPAFPFLVQGKQALQMPLVKSNHMVEQLATAAPHPTLGDSILPGYF